MNAIRKRKNVTHSPFSTLFTEAEDWIYDETRDEPASETTRDENAKSNSLCKRILRSSRSDPFAACVHSIKFLGRFLPCNAIVLLFPRPTVLLCSSLGLVSMRHSNEHRSNPPTRDEPQDTFSSAERAQRRMCFALHWCIGRGEGKANQEIKLNNNSPDFNAIFRFPRLSINVFLARKLNLKFFQKHTQGRGYWSENQSLEAAENSLCMHSLHQ